MSVQGLNLLGSVAVCLVQGLNLLGSVAVCVSPRAKLAGVCGCVFQSKEFETRLKEKKPGNLTDDLRVALGMPVGAVRLSTCQSISDR